MDHYTVPQDHLDYIPPEGILQSKIITSALQKNLNFTQGSALKPQISATRPPKGLLGLILASVEHVFKVYLSSEKGKIKKFSDDECSSIIEDYWSKLAHVRESQWKQVLASANHGNSND
ncbi:hypothetical protein BDN70DRAFT_509009 [Pholiota conissans]|uniref:Uncharacterized protein n=1 Tax=Pholiota conissans TaxID=109636 RepID=A0A9P5YQY0_9AGAR|nr:hypothetical protein BDN70DRAFT_509009 [Pholiota conissans]